MGDSDIRLEAAHIVHVKTLAEEMSGEIPWRIKLQRQFFLVIAASVETELRIEGTKIGMTTNVIPVGMRNEDRGQFGQTRRVSPQRLVGRLGGVGACPSVNTDKLSLVLRNHEIVFRELKP